MGTRALINASESCLETSQGRHLPYILFICTCLSCLVVWFFFLSCLRGSTETLYMLRRDTKCMTFANASLINISGDTVYCH